jgi:hypothetical protein
MSRASMGVVLATNVLLSMWAHEGHADNLCTSFKWDVAHERALFASAPQSVVASRDVASGPQLLPDRLYGLSLFPQDQITLSVPLGRKAQFDGAFGGFARLHVPTAGTYRIALDQPGWIDVVGNHGAIPSSDFASGGTCNAPHKLVQFELPAGELSLQLSGVASAAVRIALTSLSDR